DYITEFEALAPRTCYDDVALIRFFQRGLNSGLLERMLLTFPQLEKLDEWKERAR
ncbi:hypothetical protein DENSPDRAFT_758582, partial [Dentipellis sp. KUC8613]